MATLFVSDLHLQGERTPADALFRHFLAGPAATAEALYILGDLFEAWLGDDLILPEYEVILAALRELTDSDVPVYVMHGNRDFLLGAEFARRTGCTLLPDPSVIDLHGRPTLLMHGDLLCSDDLPYQEMRRQIRDPRWLGAFLAKSAEERIAFARQLRDTSREETGRKAGYVMDVNGETVATYLHQYHVGRLIHGHTHRPGVHALPGGAERLVLGAWDEHGSVLHCDETGCRLEEYRYEGQETRDEN
ncbi:MAG: UDP-2,3-diacylglucosamine diphosphatase [Thiohalomonadaceae bacterium]